MKHWPLAGLVLLLSVAEASAHAHLQSAVPPAGGTGQAVSELRLNFSEAVEPRFSGVTVQQQGGASVATGAPHTDPQEAKVLIVPLEKPLAPGAYQVTWHALASDTHRTQGEYKFTVQR